MVPDSLIFAIATVRGSDLTGDNGDGDNDSDPHLLLLGEVDPLAVPEDRGESGLPDPLVLPRSRSVVEIWRVADLIIVVVKYGLDPLHCFRIFLRFWIGCVSSSGW